MPKRSVLLLVSCLLAFSCLAACGGGVPGAGPAAGPGGGAALPNLAAGHVYYRIPPVGGMEPALFRTPLDGNLVPELLSDVPAAGQSVAWFAVSPNGHWVAFTEDRDTDDLFELFVARADGSDVRKVSGLLQPLATIERFIWAPDSSRIAYLADQITDDRRELFTASPTSPQPPVRVSAPLDTGQDVTLGGLQWSPDSSRLAYGATTGANDARELWTAPADGTAGAVRVSASLVMGGDVGLSAWSPDSSRIAYTADQNIDDHIELYTSLAGGGGNLRVSIPLQAGGYVHPIFSWAPDGARILYRARAAMNAPFHLYTTLPHSDAGNVRISRDLVAGGQVFIESWSPDASRVAYRADAEVVGKHELFVTLPDAETGIRVSHDMADDRRVQTYEWSPDGTQIAFISDANEKDAYALHVTTPTSNLGILTVAPGDANWALSRPTWSPDGMRIAYVRVHGTVQMERLYTAHAGFTGTATDVSGPWTYEGQIQHFVWSTDSARIIYLADSVAQFEYELIAALPTTKDFNAKIFPMQDAGTSAEGTFDVR